MEHLDSRTSSATVQLSRPLSPLATCFLIKRVGERGGEPSLNSLTTLKFSVSTVTRLATNHMNKKKHMGNNSLILIMVMLGLGVRGDASFHNLLNLGNLNLKIQITTTGWW